MGILRLVAAAAFPLGLFWLLGRVAFGRRAPGRTLFESHAFRVAAGAGLYPLVAAGFFWAGLPFTPLSVLAVAAILALAAGGAFLKAGAGESASGTDGSGGGAALLPAKGSIFPAGRWTKGERWATGLALAHFAFYAVSALRSPWLEDTDAWEHAFGAARVAATGLLSEPSAVFNLFHYMDPYPPAFEGLMGLCAAIAGTERIPEVLKIAGGSLGPALGVWLAFFWVRAMTGSERAGLFAAVLLALVPCAPTRFVWARAWVIPLFCAGAWAIEEARMLGRRRLSAVAILGGAILVQPSLPPVLVGILFLGLLLRGFAGEQGAWRVSWIPAAALALAVLSWWGPQAVLRGPAEIPLSHLRLPGAQSGIPRALVGARDDPLSPRAVVFPPVEGNRMNAPVGLGLGHLAVCALGAAFFSYRWFQGREDGGSPAVFALAACAIALGGVFALSFVGYGGARGVLGTGIRLPFHYHNGFAVALFSAVFGGISLASLRTVRLGGALALLFLAACAVTGGVPKARLLAAQWDPDLRIGSAADASDLARLLESFKGRAFPMRGGLLPAGVGRPCPPETAAIAEWRDAHPEAWPLDALAAVRAEPRVAAVLTLSPPELASFLGKGRFTHVLFDLRRGGRDAAFASACAADSRFEAAATSGGFALSRLREAAR